MTAAKRLAPLALALGLAGLLAVPAAAEKGIERWVCWDMACASRPVLERLKRPECRPIRTTADATNGTGTVKFDGLPEFTAPLLFVEGSSRVWSWAIRGLWYAFKIDAASIGAYYDGAVVNPRSKPPSQLFQCRKVAGSVRE